LAKASTISLIQTVFTRNFKSITVWYWVVIAGSLSEALLATAVISAGCSSSSLLEVPNNNTCPNNIARWVIVTTIESIFELILVIPVAMTVWNIQFGIQTKIVVTVAFLCRLIVWIPIFLHAALYIDFIRTATSSIQIVPTMVSEELWAAFSIVSASIPLIMSDVRKFSTSGMSLGTASLNNSSNRSKTEEGKQPTPPSHDYELNEAEADIALRPAHDRGAYSSSVLANGITRHISTSESKQGILRKVSFESSSRRASTEAAETAVG